MTINLTKGGNINISKTAPGLTGVLIGLGWNANSYDTGSQFDLDASASLLNAQAKIVDDKGFVFFNNKSDTSGAVTLSGDNLTGVGEGDDESVNVNLAGVPANVETIRFAVTIYDAEARKQNFGMVTNAYIRVVNPNTQEELARYDLSEDFSVETCVVPGELYRNNGEWKFKAIGAGFGGGLPAYVQSIQG
jgi:tellurium resistance protein TerD